ncbi:MAG: hypothetical protein JW863_23420 [Chitinispirillaceae bacterium]|nr:hypothetical protein [Chitinispirillaceae bacterium]
MRKSRTSDGLKVNVVAGTYVVLLGINYPRECCDGLMGFSVHRVAHDEDEAYYLKGTKTFTETDPGFVSGSQYSTREHPIQSFQWADYSAKPGARYTYTVTALKGTPQKLVPVAKSKVPVVTESPESGDHDVYFNRGTAASQEYGRRFGDRRPEEVPNNKAFEWLSRGIYEALEKFVSTCEPGRHALRIAAYEFHYYPFVQLLKTAVDRGVDVKVVYDARKSSPKEANERAIAEYGIETSCIPREEGKSYIAHNKFIVKSDNGTPVEAWTGGMNFSEGGIFGHSNVAHVIQDPAVAVTYHHYWEILAGDPKVASMKPEVEALSPLPDWPPERESTGVFSPRKTLDALSFYAELATGARDALFMTFAFGMHDLFKEVYRNCNAPLRFALMEKPTRPMKDGPEKDAEEQEIRNLRNMTENVFAVGNFIRTNAYDGWLAETLSGLNSYVRYIHNKFMLIDPLGRVPVVVTGSANFSDASTLQNDENMVVIRKNRRVADIYLGEYMRLFTHHAFRESLQWRNPDQPPKPLRTDAWWTDYFGDTDRSRRRRYFAQVKS